MSLDLGELVGTLRMDLAPFDQALSRADSDLTSFSSQAASKAKSAGTEIGSKLSSGVEDGLSGVSGASFDKLPADAKAAMDAAASRVKAGAGEVEAAAEDAGRKAGERFSDKFKESVKNTGKLVGAGVGTALGVGVVDNLSLEQSRLKLAAQLGLSVEDSARLGQIAGKVYADNWGENRDEVNTAIGAVVTSIKGMHKASDSELQAATETALAYAGVFEIDLPKAVSTAGILIKTGLAGSSGQAFDLLTKASSRVPAALREDVLDAADEYSQFFKGLGYSGEQAFDLLVQGSAKGMYGIDKAGDAVKEFTIRSTDMSASTKKAYKMIGLDAHDMTDAILAGGDRAQGATQKIIKGILDIKDPAKQSQAALALFGTPLEDLGTKDIPKFLESLQGSSGAMEGWRGSAQRMGDTAGGGTANSIETAKRRVIEWGRGVIESTGPTTAMAGAIATVGPAMLMVLGPIAQLIAARSTQAAAAASAATAETVASERSVGAWIRQSAAATANALRVAAAWVISGGAAVATYVAALAVGVAATVAGWVVMGAQALAQAARVAAAWLIAMGPIGLVIAAVVAVGVLIYKNWDNIKKWTSEAWSWVVSFIGRHATLILSVVLGPIGALVIQVIKHWDQIKAGTSAAWGAIVSFVRSIPGKLLSFFLNWTIVGVFIKHWDQMRAGAVSKGAQIVSWVSGLPGRIVGALGNLGSKLLSQGQQLIAGLQQGAANRIGAVLSWVGGLGGRIASAIPNPLGILSGIGASIVQGLKNGIDAAAHLVTEAVNAIINKIPAWVRHKLGIGSPSKVMREIASWIPAGLALGMMDGVDGVEAAVTTLTEKIDAQFEKDTNETTKKIKDKYAQLAKEIKKKLDGKAEQRALDKNDKKEEDAIKKAEKAEKIKHATVMAGLQAQLPAIRANAAEQDRIAQSLEDQSGLLATMQQQAVDYAAGVRDSFKSFGSLTGNVGEGFTKIDKLIAKREAAAKQADEFAAVINSLRGKLNDQDLQDLVAKGPEALTLAKGIAGGGDEAIAKLNALQARMQASGQALGNNVATTLYAAGINAQQSLVNGLAGNLSALKAAGLAMGNALLEAITEAMKGVGDAADEGAHHGTKGGKGGKGGKRVAENVIKAAKDRLGIRSPSTVFMGIGGNVVDGMVQGLDNKGQALEGQVTGMVSRMTDAVSAASLDVGLTASVAPPAVPESDEVSRYAAQQRADWPGKIADTVNINETTSPQATAAEVSRRQAFAGAAS